MTADASNTDLDAGEVVLDVRPLIERGEEPFGTIMETVATLKGRSLVIIAPFEPTPLEGVLSAQGFTYKSEQLGEAEWRVRFQPGSAPADHAATASPSPQRPLGAPAPRAAATSTPSPYTIRRPPSTAAQGARPSPAAAPIGTSTPAPTTAPMAPAGMPMNPTLNVPPPWLPLGFLAAAGVGLVGFGTALAITAPTVVTFPRTTEVVATAHLAVLAFLSTAVLGALHQFGPVVGGRPLRSIPAGVATAALFVPGAWLIPLGFAAGHDGIVQLGGVMATLGVCLAAWNVSRPLSSPDKGAPIVGLRLAVAYLVLTAAFGVTYAFDRSQFWFSLLDHRVLAHAHIGLLGWLGLAYVAVAEKLWPMFLLAHRPHARDGERAVWALGIGAPILLVGLLFSWEQVAIVGGAVAILGLGSHLMSLASVIRHRRRGLELLHGFVLVSAACLVIAIVTGLLAGVAPVSVGTRTRLATTEVVALVLWLTLAVLGHSHKIVPFIAWNKLRDKGVRNGRDGRPLLFSHLVAAPAAQTTFAVAVTGTAAVLVGTLTATSWSVRVGGVCLAASAVVAISNLVSGPLLMLRWHQRSQHGS